MQCICGKYIDISAYGFHKCVDCNRIYTSSVNGVSYQGVERWYNISEREEIICGCNPEHNAKYQDPVTKMYRTKECVLTEIKWLKDFKNFNDSGIWNKIMTWDERIKQLQDLVGE
jgi:hypothetical protein